MENQIGITKIVVSIIKVQNLFVLSKFVLYHYINSIINS